MEFPIFGGQSSDATGQTTRNLTLGAPEAEAELNKAAPIFLGEVFSDYLSVVPQLQEEKFIVTGRKGSGKTAIAESIRYSASQDPTTFCRMVKNKELDKETAVQEIEDEVMEVQKQLFEWVILTNLLAMITENAALEEYEAMDQLRRFINKNRGHIEIDKFEVGEVFKEKEFKVDITYLKRFFQASFSDRLGISAQKAPFYKVISHLRRVIVEVLEKEAQSIRDNNYIIIFDDLDIGFDSSSERDIKMILSLVRKAREYNNEVFGRTPIGAKVLVLLRRDIEKILMNHAADSAKIFSTYGVNLKWYEHIKFKGAEKSVKLKQFIDDRIEHAFSSKGIEINYDDPWTSLVKRNTEFYEHDTGFKFVLDHTFYRPRDIILFFQPMRAEDWDLPLSTKRIKELTVQYADEIVNEVKNELSLYYSGQQISKIFDALPKINRKYDTTYDDVKSTIYREGFSGDVDELVSVLFDYSILGNVDNEGKVKMKHRERPQERYTLDREKLFLLSYPIRAHIEREPTA